MQQNQGMQEFQSRKGLQDLIMRHLAGTIIHKVRKPIHSSISISSTQVIKGAHLTNKAGTIHRNPRLVVTPRLHPGIRQLMHLRDTLDKILTNLHHISIILKGTNTSLHHLKHNHHPAEPAIIHRLSPKVPFHPSNTVNPDKTLPNLTHKHILPLSAAPVFHHRLSATQHRIQARILAHLQVGRHALME
ncbi:MAG: hypothetical protein Q9215_001865 [Flavoplaca cf. flavocitrina]